jgi:uncharacterized damage-inducible protein DinB
MIAPDYGRRMARYALWQNRSLAAAASALTDEDRWRDRGAFFGSIAETSNHLLWGDRRWLARLSRTPEPEWPVGCPHTAEPRGWKDYRAERAALDAAMVAWADGVGAGDLHGTLRFERGGESVAWDRALCVVHMFNHGTHHRGQIHAMLTAAGAEPEPTDLPAMPRG